jgi:hypothetical protein
LQFCGGVLICVSYKIMGQSPVCRGFSEITSVKNRGGRRGGS